MQRGTQAAAAASVDHAQLGDAVLQAPIEHGVDTSHRFVDGEPVEVDFAGARQQCSGLTQSIVGCVTAGGTGTPPASLRLDVDVKRTNSPSVNDERARLDLDQKPPVLANLANGPLPHRRLHQGTDDNRCVRHGQRRSSSRLNSASMTGPVDEGAPVAGAGVNPRPDATAER